MLAFVRPEAGGCARRSWICGPRVPGVGVCPRSRSCRAGGDVCEAARMSSDGSVLVFNTGALSSAFNSGGYEEIIGMTCGERAGLCVLSPAGVRREGMHRCPRCSRTKHTKHTAEGDKGVVDSRGISADGDRVFFDSPAPLVPQDTNTDAPEVGHRKQFGPQGRDVYEWENGVVYLISRW